MIFKILIINLISSIGIFCYENIRKNNKSVIYFMMCITLPVIGVMIYLVNMISEKKINLLKNQKKDDIFQFEILNYSTDSQSAIKQAPAKDILLFGGTKKKRELIISILKKDVEHYIGILKSALLNDDHETSHYAAVGLIEFKRKKTNAINETVYKYNKDRRNREYAYEYCELLEKYLNSELLDGKSYLKYMDAYYELLKDIIDNNIALEKHYCEKINLELKLKKYEKAKETMNQFLKKFSRNEKVYMLFLKYYYLTKDINNFKEAIKEIKRLRINLSKQSVELINFWIGNNKHKLIEG